MNGESPAALTLSRYKLATFLACQRRFQLRYLQEYPWPSAPQDDEWREAGRRGEQFHRLLQRHFLGLADEESLAGDRRLREWWHTFCEEGPVLSPGRRLPELDLTVPVGRHRLTGRFDLLVLGEEAVHIYDWKTTAPRTESDLRDDWQTRLYLALAAEGSMALYPGKKSIAPEQVTLTYWFVRAPVERVTFHYDAAAHAENWGEIVALVDRLDSALVQEKIWPLTDDLYICARCRYQVFCGRQQAVAALQQQDTLHPPADDEEEPGPPAGLEPELP